MPEPGKPVLYSIPAHRAFADALAGGLIRRFGRDPLDLARGVVLVPNNRAKRTISEAFVRASGGGLLLPRLVAIGDPQLEEAADPSLDPADAPVPVPPAIAPLARRMLFAAMVQEERARGGSPVGAAEAMRLAGELGRTLDQLLVEEIAPARLRDIQMGEGLSAHWQNALALFEIVLERWPQTLRRLGVIDLATRRTLLLDRLAARWRERPPAGFVCAAGISTTAPVVARLLRTMAVMPRGMVVFAGLSTEMEADEWQALGPHEADPVTGRRARAIESHPQFQLKLLLERMGAHRDEVATWRDGGGHDSGAVRGRAISNALAPAQFTAKWTALEASARRLANVACAELATPAEEAQAIALALRETLETPGRTAALVTPDRSLARRVAAHCARWGITVDDSAGRPLSVLPSGTLLTALAAVAAEQFAPLALLALLKHPLVKFGEDRLAWLDGVRTLDKALRGPRPAPGLQGIADFLTGGDIDRDHQVRRLAAAWWPGAQALLAPLESAMAIGRQPVGAMLAALREASAALCGDVVWQGPAGRATADLLAELEAEAARTALAVEPADLAPMLRVLMDEVAVRPPQGGHPRIAIYGLIEARLQNADLMILGGLNEGVWPGQPTPDPWLAPRIRAELGMPGLERRVGVTAHDFATALGAPQVLLTRARRGARAPAIASRFWLRLQAMSGGIPRAHGLEHWARTLDAPSATMPAACPAPVPPDALRPKRIAVTDVDRLKADPYAFYAKHILRLRPLDPVDADPSAAWRGTAVHAILERWAKEDACAPEALRPRALMMLNDARTHPMMRALWQPRLLEAIDWIAASVADQRANGRQVLAAECAGEISIAGVTLKGTADRVDLMADGTLAIVDYKTGKPPSPSAVRAGYSLQLGLLGLIAERGGFAPISGEVSAFEYWSLARDGGSFGKITSPVDRAGKANKIATADFTKIAAHNFTDAAQQWLTGTEPFTAKLVPEYAPYAEYDQLMRRDEWYGRQ
ncbi:MAG: double-strand break repair protein AddB [Sphingomonas sp.]